MRDYSIRKRVLVTGGAGFLGSHLVESLLEQGNEVICLDNLFTGIKQNIEHLLGNPRFEFIRHDVTNPLYYEVDEIYNLACPASPIHYQHDPVQTIKTSVHGAINVLDLAKRLNVRILQASTSEVYGDPAVHPQSEEYWGNVNPIGPRSCYDEGKRCAETLFFDYHRQYGLDIRVVRIFNTYGPRMHPNDGRVISNFIIQALRGEDITIYGNGSQTRSFCYVDDMVDGFLRFMAVSDRNCPGPINLGNPREFTIRQLGEIVIEMTGSSSKLVFHTLPTDDPKQRQPDISRARELLEWHPETEVESGLRKTISYFDKLLSEENY
ncbi:UDP-glucuronic acid decarboxylase family protein [Pollutimonas sp. M17]|uniref:UDP-glucuronic acid decarboxylase family protein n=1 Tax=Pollutimonas sp. M17 TaxID=2962065 RepID=UPI0021F45181|nr:UDP-glucuronic acid decarboxylase family protein [Pollutimonas sp. M17]UYO93985.1 SDR family oxidoreductase [Pollutimonas sp. M17]